MDIRQLAKTLSQIENREGNYLKILADFYRRQRFVPVLGVTGPPGAGKSTLVDRFISLWRAEGKKVAVIAIDPSSPFTGGAVLGDRIRMQNHAGDDGVFIRSLGSRGVHGGLARATFDLKVAFDAAGFDRIVIETVGVGQTELDITGIAKTTLVILVPEAGDVVQTLKAGLTEIADVFAVNKADREGGSDLASMLKAIVEMGPPRSEGWTIPVCLIQATRDVGIKELFQILEKHFVWDSKGEKQKGEAIRKTMFLDLCQVRLQDSLKERFEKEKGLKKILEEVSQGGANPYEAIEKIKL